MIPWQNADGTLYPVANLNWQAELEGNTNVPGKGVTSLVCTVRLALFV
jgi:hypothetical protein